MPTKAHLIIPLLLTGALAAPLARAQSVTSVQDGPPSTITLVSPTDSSSADVSEYLTRRTSLKDDDYSGMLDLAHWACDHDLFAQSADLCRLLLTHDPDNHAAWTLFKEVDAAISLPAEPANEAALKSEFQDRFKRPFSTRNTRHFLIVYDCTDAFAAQRGGVLEHAYDSFLFYFSMNKLHPQFLDKRLVVILFKTRADYLTYAKQTEGSDLSWAAGYYSQRTNRTAFYDDSTSPSTEKVEADIDKLRAALKQINADIDTARAHNQSTLANNLTAKRNQLSDAIFQINNRVNNAIGQINDSKTLHEAAHQLAFNTDIQKRLVDYPLWFTEGLACCFETEDRFGSRGPTVINYDRVTFLKQALKTNQLLPLENFIGHAQPLDVTPNSLSIFYAESWALFHYLYRFNRAGTEKFLLTYLHTPMLRQIPDADRLARFTAAFGSDIPDLQKKLFAYIQSLPDKAP